VCATCLDLYIAYRLYCRREPSFCKLPLEVFSKRPSILILGNLDLFCNHSVSRLKIGMNYASSRVKVRYKILIIAYNMNSHISESRSTSVLVGKTEVKRPLGRLRRRWEDNIKKDLQEVGGGRGSWMGLAQNIDRWRALVGTVRVFRVP
jgi:hypothetical protein